MTGSRLRPYVLAVAAAAFFGASFPLSKLLLRDLGPIGLAGLLYLSSGVGETPKPNGEEGANEFLKSPP